MKGSDKLLYVSLFLLAVGVAGFTYYHGAYDRSAVREDLGTDYKVAATLDAERGHSYEVHLTFEGDNGLPWNKVDADASVLFNGDAIYERSFAVTEFPGKKAKDGFVFKAVVKADGLLSVEGRMRAGSLWRLVIYRDLPPLMDVGPFLSAIVGLLGLVGFAQSSETY